MPDEEKFYDVPPAPGEEAEGEAEDEVIEAMQEAKEEAAQPTPESTPEPEPTPEPPPPAPEPPTVAAIPERPTFSGRDEDFVRFVKDDIAWKVAHG